MIRRWWFSLFLGAVYLATFHLWLGAAHSTVVVVGLAASLSSGVVFAWAAKRGFFLNRWDGFIHAAVIADIFLEAIMVRNHDSYGFYGCALGFAAVLVFYRAWFGKTRFPPRSVGGINC